jgi:hypothetical protein
MMECVEGAMVDLQGVIYCKSALPLGITVGCWVRLSARAVAVAVAIGILYYMLLLYDVEGGMVAGRAL